MYGQSADWTFYHLIFFLQLFFIITFILFYFYWPTWLYCCQFLSANNFTFCSVDNDSALNTLFFYDYSSFMEVNIFEVYFFSSWIKFLTQRNNDSICSSSVTNHYYNVSSTTSYWKKKLKWEPKIQVIGCSTSKNIFFPLRFS